MARKGSYTGGSTVVGPRSGWFTFKETSKKARRAKSGRKRRRARASKSPSKSGSSSKENPIAPSTGHHDSRSFEGLPKKEIATEGPRQVLVVRNGEKLTIVRSLPKN